jgi:hypothetical protein
MDAYNASAIASYSDAGISEVQAIDGDQDEECAARDGETFSTDEADTIEDHPNGTLDWVPVIGEAKAGPVSSSTAPRRESTPLDPAAILAYAEANATRATNMVEQLTALQVAQKASEATMDTNAQLADLADAIRNQPAAIHHIDAPIVNVLPGEPDVHNINVPAPVVNVAAPVTVTAPDVHVHIPEPKPRTVKRDNVGNIIGLE